MEEGLEEKEREEKEEGIEDIGTKENEIEKETEDRETEAGYEIKEEMKRSRIEEGKKGKKYEIDMCNGPILKKMLILPFLLCCREYCSFCLMRPTL